MANKKPKKIGIYDSCINKYVYDEIPEGSHCLDVGCWTGNLGKKLIKMKKCSVDGVDFVFAVLVKARKNGYGKTYCMNLNSNPNEINKIKSKYDCIICADVLEHLINPGLVLSLLKKKLNNKGILVISVPNIAFLKQRMEIFEGKFDYNPKGGIMDETHLRFFTAKSLRVLCERSGFDIKSFYGYSLVKNKFFFLRYLAKWWPELFAIQLIAIVKPKGQ
ncbi:MAG: bifunctional 3-demethylubiquinone-9 3-methyltransferase/ 2-octaprenyl-6-hydroxy phenol methylase [Parcubacteria group bacterium ADurb.Bin326]|nr:MAG: bifunctional 3-demethylubiquinone-9 3-methyltransferase/ 2-octaprenyl-6-hydroxy phenol methylase [Parcubacteria group bacterium ADurb.Bin326]